MAANKTSLSAGEIIRAVLLEDPEVAKRTNKIFPVDTTEAVLPYILYRRASLEATPQKEARISNSDVIGMEVVCFTNSYSEGVELAEAVRGALDNVEAEHNGQRIRGCYLSGGEEYWNGDAFVQELTFTLRI